jgi:ribosomal protein S18 acetylase RimI-like enzyme
MEIRPATLVELNSCMALDDSFETEYVWQMDQKNDSKQISIGFKLTRLPRPMRVSTGISRDQVSEDFMAGKHFLIADDGKIRGYIDFCESEWNETLMVNNLLVAQDARRRGLGTMLLQEALKWGKGKKFRLALASASTKNYPGICLLQNQGFAFCGFNDQYYPNRDIAMTFALSLK